MRTLTALEKWSYAIGNMPYAVKDAAFINFVVFYYTQVHGLSGSLAGLSMFIALIFDAVSDPVVGSWSDTIKTRWGRRHPMLLAGGLPMALLFLALFSPPEGLGESGIFIWLTVVAILLRTFLTIYFIPYSAMGAELSPDYDERTVIAKARVTMAWLAGMCLPTIAFVFIFTSDGETDGRLIAENYDLYGIVSAILAAVTILFCAWGTRTVISRLPQSTAKDNSFTFAQTLVDARSALTNRNFRLAVGASLSFGMAGGVYSTLGLHLGTYFWEFTTDQLAGLIVPMAVATMLSFVLVGKLSKRYDKPALLKAACLGIGINALWFIGLRLLNILPENGHAIIYPLQWLNTVFAVTCIVVLQTVLISLIADILDEQELNTGLRQEGVFFAANSFVQKATTGVGALVAGIIVDIAGIAAGSEPGEVGPESLAILGWFTMIVIVTLAFIAFLFARRISLSRVEHEAVTAALGKKREAAA
ncbi:MAG: GPH family glycoside/pentoside/hexuronide:cation symporter [Halioglobus sp.]|jgi:GPH family glycoside/pentoside/hexuronide:cation symporter